MPAWALIIYRDHFFLMQVDVSTATRIPLGHNRLRLVEEIRVWNHHIYFLQTLKISE